MIMTTNGNETNSNVKYQTSDGYIFDSYVDAFVHNYSSIERGTHNSTAIEPYHETYY